MGILSKIKNMFSKKKVKKLAASTNTDKTVKLALREKNPDRILDILTNCGSTLTSNEIMTIILKLPINKRLDGMRAAKRHLTPYDLFEIINNKLDGNNKLHALEEFQNQLDLYDIYKIFDNLSPDKRTAALEICLDRFDSFSLGELIKLYIPLVERSDMLYKYDELIDSFSKADIIKKMIPDETIKALEKYGSELNSNNICEIITSMPMSHITQALKTTYKYLNQNQIRDIIMYNIPEYQRLEALESCSDVLDISIKTDIIKYSIPDKDKETAVTDLADSLDSDHVSNIIEDLRISANFVKVLTKKFGFKKEDIG